MHEGPERFGEPLERSRRAIRPRCSVAVQVRRGGHVARRAGRCSRTRPASISASHCFTHAKTRASPATELRSPGRREDALGPGQPVPYELEHPPALAGWRGWSSSSPRQAWAGGWTQSRDPALHADTKRTRSTHCAASRALGRSWTLATLDWRQPHRQAAAQKRSAIGDGARARAFADPRRLPRRSGRQRRGGRR